MFMIVLYWHQVFKWFPRLSWELKTTALRFVSVNWLSIRVSFYLSEFRRPALKGLNTR